MKAKYLLMVIAGMLLCAVACRKDLKDSKPATKTDVQTIVAAEQHGYTSGVTNVDTITPGAGITGVWKLTSDSTYRGGGNLYDAYNYQGQAADYFDFRADGHVYTKENGVLDTFNYQLSADTSLYMANITADGLPKDFHVSTFTAHKFVGATKIYATPGGEFGRKISLTR